MSFLTLGLPASAAAAHRHEFSGAQAPTPPPASIAPYSISAVSQAVYRKDLRLIHNPYIREEEELEDRVRGRGKIVQVPGEAGNGMEGYAQGVDGMAVSTEEDGGLTSRPETPTADGRSASVLGAAGLVAGISFKPAVQKQKSVYHLAYPPPGTIHSRLVHTAKPVLQLQRTSETSRAVPELDVMYTSAVPGRSRKVFGPAKGEFMLIASEDYEREEEDEGALGRIISLRKGGSLHVSEAPFRQPFAALPSVAPKAKSLGAIQTSSGLNWEISRMSNGGYEFTAHDPLTSSSRTARWVPRAPSSSRRVSAAYFPPSGTDSLKSPPTSPGQLPTSPPASITGEKKFVFSILNPSTRKHPILASLTARKLEVLEHNVEAVGIDGVLSRPSSPEGQFSPQQQPLKELSNASLPTLSSSDEGVLGLPCHDARMLALASGAWVALAEGWEAGEVRPGTLSRRGTCLSSTSSTPVAEAGSLGRSTSTGGSRRWTGDFSLRGRGELRQSLTDLAAGSASSADINTGNLNTPVNGNRNGNGTLQPPSGTPTRSTSTASHAPSTNISSRGFGEIRRKRESMPVSSLLSFGKKDGSEVDKKEKKKRGFRGVLGGLFKKKE